LIHYERRIEAMTWIYVYESEVIKSALERLREDGIFWQDTSVDHDAP
jgi:hypothetical protein